ncbi:MAG: hypothetical protein BRC30_02585 [Nanohaloarchaea archaeon SW_7_46_7]|nr:MAG: hypothetical protein BRC30_02585 [Nanohaloarchaea archaeon SW_7_46_7]
MEEEYRKLAEIAIQKEMSVMGSPVALRQARKVPDMEINDEGEIVESSAPGKNIFQELLNKFKEATGPVAVAVISTALKQETDEITVDLPDEVEEKL